MVGVVEGLGDVRVDVDEHVVLERHLRVTLDALLLDEVREGVADLGEDHVDEPLLGQMRDLLLIRQEHTQVGVLLPGPE